MDIIASFLRDKGLEGKPLYFLGSSSGATFALKMPK